MNGCGKSDTPILPEKLSNKVKENPTAERVEGRGVTKGNEKQQNTRQAQDWGSVHSALQLVHRKAKMDKKMQFTTLMHHVYQIEALRGAYSSLRRDAAPGVDKETWRSYEEMRKR